ncbi:diacylglycerol kinase [Massilia cavernae]|uniref:Diacylglycerol kinase n=1 Tax=Massilia cavernae TaxID=2320864 RepID=A0A418XPU3_9BURK|nr:diacylglycerol kinase [Massilia cavernae]RJG14533.1 diacylglycerol kinase [Massilia cavernae]
MEQPVSEFKSKGGLGRISGAVRNTMDGFRTAWRHEHAFRQEVVVVIIGTIAALLLPISAFQKAFLIAVMLFVLTVELINSAIEAVIDRISLERHPLSKNAKDLGSAAVAVAMAIAAISWIVVLFNRFY